MSETTTTKRDPHLEYVQGPLYWAVEDGRICRAVVRINGRHLVEAEIKRHVSPFRSYCRVRRWNRRWEFLASIPEAATASGDIPGNPFTHLTQEDYDRLEADVKALVILAAEMVDGWTFRPGRT